MKFNSLVVVVVVVVVVMVVVVIVMVVVVVMLVMVLLLVIVVLVGDGVRGGGGDCNDGGDRHSAGDSDDESLPIRICTFGFATPFSISPPGESLNGKGLLTVKDEVDEMLVPTLPKSLFELEWVVGLINSYSLPSLQSLSGAANKCGLWGHRVELGQFLQALLHPTDLQVNLPLADFRILTSGF
ncbi:hypothetical protein MUG91_G22n123 [Manis pentadactyla]|nr:hypothetical protein MUG91_G22n123 [Manis pentadactyla]